MIISAMILATFAIIAMCVLALEEVHEDRKEDYEREND
jgi:hypothetical protein